VEFEVIAHLLFKDLKGFWDNDAGKKFVSVATHEDATILKTGCFQDFYKVFTIFDVRTGIACVDLE
jgi:hypothetical protein